MSQKKDLKEYRKLLEKSKNKHPVIQRAQDALSVNCVSLQEQIILLKSYNNIATVPSDLIKKIDDLGTYIKNCAYHLNDAKSH